MKVLITGGAGYIGSHCNRYFADKGTDTVVLDDLSSGHKEAVIAGKFVQGDFGDEIFINELLEKEKFDAIIHFAAFASVPDSVMHPSKYYINNVSKMVTLLDTAVKHGVKYFVFSGLWNTLLRTALFQRRWRLFRRSDRRVSRSRASSHTTVVTYRNRRRTKSESIRQRLRYNRRQLSA